MNLEFSKIFLHNGCELILSIFENINTNCKLIWPQNDSDKDNDITKQIKIDLQLIQEIIEKIKKRT
jgi:hypothetical protein